MKLRNLLFVTLTLVFAGSGCLSMKECNTRYNVDKSLATEVQLDVLGITSDATSPEHQKKEMKAFYDKLAKDTAQSMASLYGIAGELDLSFTDKTDTKCNARMKGKTNHLAQALIGLAGPDDFEIKKKDGKLTVKIDPYKSSGTPPNVKSTITIKYAGKVIQTNAHKHDKKTGLMQWNVLKNDGFQFILEVQD